MLNLVVPPKVIAFSLMTLMNFVGSLEVVAQSRVYKCVDAAGKVTLSDRGCSVGDDAAIVKISPANSLDGSLYREQSVESIQSPAAPEQTGSRAILITENKGSDPERRRLCKEASTPYRGAHGLTAAQRVASAQLCADVHLVTPSASGGTRSVLSTHPTEALPGPITSCDPGGCWDSNGVRYTQGADSTYFPSTGGAACQLVNGNMICP